MAGPGKNAADRTVADATQPVTGRTCAVFGQGQVQTFGMLPKII